MRAAAIVLGLLLLVATPAFAGDDFTSVVKDALASAEPATALLRGFAKLPDFDMTGDDVARSLEAAGAPLDGPVGQILGDVTRVSKKGDRISIARTRDQLTPIVVKGQTKGYVQLGKSVAFRIRSSGDAVTLDKFDGVKVGESAKKLYDLWNLGWKPGAPDSTLSLTAGWGIFSKSLEWKVPNPPAPAAPAAPTPTAPTVEEEPAAAAPSQTQGILGKVGD